MYLEKALIIKEYYYGITHPDITQTLVELGKTYKSLRNIKQAEIMLERALRIREKYFGKNHPLTIEIVKILDYM